MSQALVHSLKCKLQWKDEEKYPSKLMMIKIIFKIIRKYNNKDNNIIMIKKRIMVWIKSFIFLIYFFKGEISHISLQGI